jgi:galactokinase
MDSLIRTAVEKYNQRFGEMPSACAVAPGRVEVLGNHTDYNEGFVISCAIDRYVAVAAGPNTAEESFEFYSTHFDTSMHIDTVEPNAEHNWVNYPLGVYAGLKKSGYPLEPFKAVFHSSIPLGAGLSSSAAMEVATGLALSSLFGFSVGKNVLARYCQMAEHTFCGTRCGLLDQLSSLFGKQNHLLCIDFRTLEHHPVPLPSKNISLAITLSGVTHALSDSAYNERHDECEAVAQFFARRDVSVKTLRDITFEKLSKWKKELDQPLFNRATHIIGENERVEKAMRALNEGDIAAVGQLLFDSHKSSRYLFENSCPELDTLVEIASSIDGVYGSRLTGAGFGGATLSMLHTDAQPSFEHRVYEDYLRKTGRKADIYFAGIADGARIITLTRL